MPEKKKLSKTREMLVNEYVKSLEQDQLPWIKEWGSKPPHNAITKTPYRQSFTLVYSRTKSL